MKQNIYNLKNQILKKIVTGPVTAMVLACASFCAGAQVTVSDFETFTLSPNSAYSPTTSTGFQTSNASFNHVYQFSLWLGGFAYTNINDSVNGDFNNLYGIKAYKGYTNSATYVVGQDGGVVTTTAVPQTTVAGFYITNTTYAWKSMKIGDSFSRKFGDTTGTGSGTTIAQGAYPDYLKVVIKGYNNGALKNDSVTVMLADFTFTNNAQDYILKTWQFVNTAIIGEVDSIKFVMRSSDNSGGYMNTPGFFAIDNFATGKYDLTGIAWYQKNNLNAEVFPNPFKSSITIRLPAESTANASVVLSDINGKIVFSENIGGAENAIDLNSLATGVYFLEISSGERKSVKRIIKN